MGSAENTDSSSEIVLAALTTDIEPTETERLVEEHSPHSLVEILARPRHDIDAQDGFGWTCLHHAAALGLTEHVEALVNAGTVISSEPHFKDCQILTFFPCLQ
eukprot:SAG31_NODE_5591_length_2437_cov_1.515398_5_plen_103_part_00